MKFSAREDIAASIDDVFCAVTDVDAFERAALRRGLDVTRLDGDGPPGEGACWDVGFDLRGQRRQAQTTITGWDPEQGVTFFAASDGLRADGLVDLTPLAKARTRLLVSVDLRPETFRARLLLQSLKLARSNLEHRFKSKIAGFARQIEGG